ncbi:MAG TPA: biopolymer transporter ExbD [Burkholderiales bacterium]|nr:biopolymer transporter ExbD [Burkholderiales bacterium]
MAFGGFDQNSSQPMSEINVTPLVDVMLVLLVIFIVTAPLFTHAVKVDLPQTVAKPAPQKPDTIVLAIDGEGRVFWNTQSVALTELSARLTQAAAKQPQPEIHLHADKATRYQALADVMAAVQNAGLQKIAFTTNPGKGR